MSDDRELLRRFARGDARAMDELVDRHAGAVYAFARRYLGDPQLAEDVTQEVWLKVLKSPGSFDGRAQFTTWLFSVTRNACVDHVRRGRRRAEHTPAPDHPFRLDGVAHPGPPIHERVAQRELNALVEHAVADLPAEQREVFLLREQTALTFAEIGEALDLPRDTVKSRMRYALGNIRRHVRRALGQEVSARGV